jgi:hypothetical protein
MLTMKLMNETKKSENKKEFTLSMSEWATHCEEIESQWAI